MGRNEITRTMTTTIVKSGVVAVEKGNPVFKEVKQTVFNGTLTPEKALREIQKAYGKTAVVIEQEVQTSTYVISVADFMKYAKKVEKSADEAKEG